MLTDTVTTPEPTMTPAADPVPAQPLSAFAARIAELRAEPEPTPEPEAAAEPETVAEVVPEAGEASPESSVTAPEPVEATLGGNLVAKLPGRGADDPDFELPLDRAALEAAGLNPAEVTDRLNQLRNGYMRRQEVTQHLERIQSDRAELDAIESDLRTDPGGFLSERVSPAVQEQVAEKLLKRLSPESWERLMSKVAKWDQNPTERTTEATLEENARLRADRQRRVDADAQSQTTTTAKSIAQAVTGIIPETMSEEEGDEFFDYAVFRLQGHIDRNKIEKLDPSEVPQILADLKVLPRFGLDSEPTPAAGSTPAKPARPKSPATPAQAEAASRTGKDLKARQETRRSAAATTPAGAGAGTSGIQVPKGQTGKERIASLRKLFGVE